MPHKPRKKVRRKKVRSPDQQAWAAAVGDASQAWEQLTDQERLALRVEASAQHTTGQRWFVKLNARRLFNGQPLLLNLPRRKTFSGPLRYRFVIRNLGGHFRFQVEFSKPPVHSVSVWASLPWNRGAAVCDKIPRLGPLPEPEDGVSDFTELYFRKYGAQIVRRKLKLVGKRIFIRLREERDDGPGLFHPADTVVPTP